MKKYNKPVVEINGFEVEDVITESGNTALLTGNDITEGAYKQFAGGSASSEETVLVYEW